MARLGQGLIQGLVNPSFGAQLGQAGMLAGSLPGRMREAQAEQAKLEAQRRAQESIYQILNQNPLDPNTVQSAQAVGAQMGLDPNAVQTAIRQAQTGARENERLAMARKEALYKASDQRYKEFTRTKEQEQDRVAQFLEGVITSDADLDTALTNVPEEHREFARQYANKYQEFLSDSQEWREKVQSNQPISQEEEEFWRSNLPEEVVRQQMRLASTTPGPVRRRLNSLAEAQLKQDMKKSTNTTTVPQWRVRAATEMLDRVDFTPGGPWWDSSKWGRGTPDEFIKNQLAERIARKQIEDPGYAFSEETIRQMEKDLAAELSVGDEETEGGRPSDIPQAEWDAMTPEEKALWQ